MRLKIIVIVIALVGFFALELCALITLVFGAYWLIGYTNNKLDGLLTILTWIIFTIAALAIIANEIATLKDFAKSLLTREPTPFTNPRRWYCLVGYHCYSINYKPLPYPIPHGVKECVCLYCGSKCYL